MTKRAAMIAPDKGVSALPRDESSHADSQGLYHYGFYMFDNPTSSQQTYLYSSMV
jgi:hypothetical protein